MTAPLGIPVAKWARAAAILVGALILAWVAQASTIATALGARRLASTLSWWPSGAEGLAAAAANQLAATPRTPARLAEAEALARRALRRDPASVVAARTLGLALVERGDRDRGEAMLRYAEALSRRDLATQLYFIEANVQRNDIAGALRHYDRALRTSPRARDILLPILVQASSDTDIARSLAALIGQHPPWRNTFLIAMAQQGSSAAALEQFVRAARLDPDEPGERRIFSAALQRMVTLGGYRAAYQLYEALGRPAPTGKERVRNGGFEDADGFGPFDWSYASRPALAGVVSVRSEGGGRALTVSASPGASGEVARQLLLLPPGRYRLSYELGNPAANDRARLGVKIGCAGGGATLFEAPIAGAADARPDAGTFAVPTAACPAQLLSIRYASDEEPGGTAEPTPWIDNISIHPL